MPLPQVNKIQAKQGKSWKTTLLTSALVITTSAAVYFGFLHKPQHATIEQTITEQTPAQANQAIVYSLNQLDPASIEQATYLAMYKALQPKFEEQPQLLDHLGPNAQHYMMQKPIREIQNQFDQAITTGRQKIEQGIKDVKECEQTKHIYDTVTKYLQNALEDICN